MFFENIEATWLQNFSEIHCFQYRKSGSKIGNVRIVQAQIVEQSPLLMQFLYGVTTLRVMCMKSVPPQDIEIAPASEIHHVGAPNGSGTSIFGRNLDFQKF